MTKPQSVEPGICGVVCYCGPNGEPLACGYAAGHDGTHAWASLPTFTEGEPMYVIVNDPDWQAAADAFVSLVRTRPKESQ